MVSPLTPSFVYIDAAVHDLPHTQRILSRLPDVQSEVLEDVSWLKTTANYVDGKSIWLLTRQSGTILKPLHLPPIDQPDRHYMQVDFASNCPMDCTFCPLQETISAHPLMTIYTNVEEIVAHVTVKASKKPKTHFIINTGEHVDSLALDDILGVHEKIIPYFAFHTNVTLEVRTRTDNIDHLLDLPHRQRTILTWALNTPNFIATEEPHCATLDQRLAAAKRCIEAGYRVGFYLAPIIRHDGWEKHYADVIDRVLDTVPNQHIAWIGLETLHFTEGLKTIAAQRHRHTRIFYDEHVLINKTFRYFKPIRREIYTHLRSAIHTRLPDLPVLLCHETSEMKDSLAIQI